MILVLGLVLLIAAVVVGVAGVLTNHGNGHGLTHGFAVLGYHVTGSTGTLFLYGMVVGAVAVLGLSLLLASARRTSRRGSAARRGLEAARGETVAVRRDRDELIDQREAARAETASVLRESAPTDDGHLIPVEAQRRRRHRFGHRAAVRRDVTITPADD